MPFDGIVLSAVAAQLSNTIIGGRIDKIYQPEHDEVLFSVNTRDGKIFLYISSNSAHPRISLITETGPNPQNPMGFCMLLRKHIQSGRITKIAQRGSERILEISVDTVSELGFSQNKTLLVEIMGKHSNILLIDSNTGIIIDSIKRLTLDMNRHRQTLPGSPYKDPPAQNKISWYELTSQDIRTIADEALEKIHGIADVSVDSALTDELCGYLAESLAGKVQGVSKRYAEELANEIVCDLSLMNADKVQGVSECPVEELATERVHDSPKMHVYKTYEIGRFREKLREASGLVLYNFVDRIKKGQFSPRVYFDSERQPVDFHAFPLNTMESGCDIRSFDDISPAIEFYYLNKSSTNKMRQKTADMLKVAVAGLDKLLLKKQRLLEDILKAKNADTYRLHGELLTANLHRMKQGEKSVTLTNYYDNTEMIIPLDTRLTPAKNAQRWYKLYDKAKKTVIEKSNRLEETENDIKYLESVRSYIENIVSLDETDALRHELAEVGFMRRQRQLPAKKQARAESWSYTISEGFDVFAGRNNLDNDLLTFKKAAPKDIWFHAKDIPGSHVILFTKGAEPDEQSIFKAAAIAAWHSSARHSENVPVDYTFVKHVKKPSGAKPGMVIFTNNRTVYVNPALP